MASANPLAPFGRLLTNPSALLGGCIAVMLILAAVRAHSYAPPPKPLPVLRQFAAAIDQQYHECVPLGWFPDSRPWRGYVSSYDADVVDPGAVFHGLWTGVLPARSLGEAHAVAVKGILDELTRLGLMVRRDLPDGFRYNLTREGEQYYYERDNLGDNNEAWPYLCFSRLHAKNVAWASRPSKSAGKNGVVTARVRFTWEPAAAADWVTPFLRAHAVELNPTSSPAVATAYRRYDGTWRLAELDFAFPLVENRSAWVSAAE